MSNLNLEKSRIWIERLSHDTIPNFQYTAPTFKTSNNGFNLRPIFVAALCEAQRRIQA
jgi:hypothetical protein